MVIGHELTHGFDDEGRQFDAKGNLEDWWTAEDAKEFQQRTACVADEYSSFSAAPGAYINGKLTLGENTADNGGVRIALMALLNTIGNAQQKIDGFTPEQRFFLSFGQIWCENQREESVRHRLAFSVDCVALQPHTGWKACGTYGRKRPARRSARSNSSCNWRVRRFSRRCSSF